MEDEDCQHTRTHTKQTKMYVSLKIKGGRMQLWCLNENKVWEMGEGATTKAARVEPRTFTRTRPMKDQTSQNFLKTETESKVKWWPNTDIMKIEKYQDIKVFTQKKQGHCTVTNMSPTPTTLVEKEQKKKSVWRCAGLKTPTKKILIFFPTCDFWRWSGHTSEWTEETFPSPRAVRHQSRDELLHSPFSVPR